jgi:hypothetical protein
MYFLPSIQGLKQIKYGDLELRKYIRPAPEAEERSAEDIAAEIWPNCPMHDKRMYRSTIYDASDNLVCFSPPKSDAYSVFKTNIPMEKVQVTEFVDGTMINVFYHDGVWRIATKSVVDADCRYYSDAPTFAEMFYEALGEIKLDSLEKSLTYSFVLQHPKNRIVTRIQTPNLYLIRCYKIIGHVVYEIDDPTPFQRPQTFAFADYEALENALSEKSYEFQGFMLKSGTMRAKLRNPRYNEVRELRGNTPSLRFHILTLRQEGKCHQFSRFYPEFNKDVVHCDREVTRIVNLFYASYLDCFVKKERRMAELNKHVGYHVYQLHGLYLKTRPVPIHKARVREYVESLAASQLVVLFL